MSETETPEADPIARFRDALERAWAREPFEANAVALATADAEARPSVRIVLLKGVDARGFVFYTNRESRKGRELDGNPSAALCFHWPKGQEQVRVEGVVERVSDTESDEYFASRPRGSQVGAWASEQSRPIASREALERKVQVLEARYENKPVPRPPHWGGYRIVPHRIEFWHGQPSRLHDREVYSRDEGSEGAWTVVRLQP